MYKGKGKGKGRRGRRVGRCMYDVDDDAKFATFLHRYSFLALLPDCLLLFLGVFVSLLEGYFTSIVLMSQVSRVGATC